MVALKANEDIDAVIDAFCAAFGVNKGTLLSRDRHEDVAECRQAIYYYLRNYTPMTFARIGFLLGRDHGAVMRGVFVFSQLLGESNQRILRLYNAAISLCGQSPQSPHRVQENDRIAQLEHRVTQLEKLLSAIQK